MNDGDARARVVEIVFVIIGRQQRIDHRDHRADPRRAKPGPDKLRTIRQDDQHAIFNLNAQLAQSVADAIRHARRVAISERLIFVVEADFVFAPFLQIVVEEVVGHVEAFGKLRRHWFAWIQVRAGTRRSYDFASEATIKRPRRNSSSSVIEVKRTAKPIS